MVSSLDGDLLERELYHQSVWRQGLFIHLTFASHSIKFPLQPVQRYHPTIRGRGASSAGGKRNKITRMLEIMS
jgi:hypothetical protein